MNYLVVAYGVPVDYYTYKCVVVVVRESRGMQKFDLHTERERESPSRFPAGAGRKAGPHAADVTLCSPSKQ